MISFLLVIALQQEPTKEGLENIPPPQQVLEPEQADRPRPTTYYWTDRAGRRYVTTTVPPAGANVIREVSQRIDETEDEPEEIDIQPTPAEIRAEMESVLDKKTISYWHEIDKLLFEARLAGNDFEIAQTIDGLVDDALWVDGLRVALLLPLVIMAICMLLAWWVCSSMTKSGKSATKYLAWTVLVFSGISTSHITLQHALYLPQAKRMDFMLSMLPNYLGGHIEAKPETLQAIRNHAVALLDASALVALPWAFPLEVGNAKTTLHRVVADP